MPRLDTGQVGDVLSGLDHEFRCDDTQFALLTGTLGPARPDHAIQLLQSVTRDGSPQRLLDGLDGLSRAGHLVPRLPTTISVLEEVVAAALLPQPPPTPPQPRPRRHHRTATTTHGAPARPATSTPPQQPPAGPPDSFDHPASWLPLDRATVGDIELVLPTGPAELGRWGVELRNCLGSYTPIVNKAERLVLGIRIRGRLAGAVEVDPTRRSIVQIEAANNRPLPREARQTVAAMLLARGVITAA